MSKQSTNITPLVFTGVALIGGYYLLKGSKNLFHTNVIVPKQTADYISRLRVLMGGVKFRGKEIEFNLSIENPNDKPVTIKSIVGDVFAESNQGATKVKLGNLDRFGVTVIKPNGATSYPFKITLKLLNTAGFISQMLMGQVKGILLRFIGTINIDGNDYPVNKTFLIS